ncbi:MAG: SIMPL domain-containing protein, partial [Gemmatimonadales bacterium]
LSAHGETKVAPDTASLTLGVETKGDTAAAAMAANAGLMTRVIAALGKAGVATSDIATSQINLAPQYLYQPNQPPRLTGYQADNQVTVTLAELGKLGGVIDAAVSAGATNVSGVSFSVANPVPADNTARVGAMKALQDKAALYAQLAGYHIVRLVNLTEGAPEVGGPRPMFAMAQAKAVATPVKPGQTTVGVDITAVFELAH